MITERGETPRVLEVGSGLSTSILSGILKTHDSAKLVSIDFGSAEAMTYNSRGLYESLPSKPTKGSFLYRQVQAASVGLAEIRDSWANVGSRQLRGLSYFIDSRLDTRKISMVEGILGQRISEHSVTEEILSNGFASKIFDLFRHSGDEIETLSNLAHVEPVLEHELNSLKPNMVFLDSGEFSTLAEFDVLDSLAPPGCLLLVQDILFPKSIKGFVVGAELLNSNRWSILWIDRSTPQGMLLALRR